MNNVQVSAGTSNSTDSGPIPFPWQPVGYGYYNRSDFYNGHYYRAWADNSNSTGDNPAGALKTLDVYTANVVLKANATIMVTGINIATTAGAPFTGTVASFASIDASHTAGSYLASISWWDGTTSSGVISGTSAMVVKGSHTYANPGTYAITILVHDNLGIALDGQATANAGVTSLGINAGSSKEAKYWASNTGQALIKSFNGGSSHTELSSWLASNFPNLYGNGAGANNLTGKTNIDVASLFSRIWQSTSDGAYAQILTTALDVYASTTSLGGAQGAGAGFQVSATGEGARLFNVGAYGAAVGVANNTTLNVFQMLKAANDRALNGILYNGNNALIATAKTLFDKLNTI